MLLAFGSVFPMQGDGCGVRKVYEGPSAVEEKSKALFSC